MKRYKDAFQDLRVPEDMLDRVLQSRKKKQARRRVYLGAAGAAACCAIAVGTAVLVPQPQGKQPSSPAAATSRAETPSRGRRLWRSWKGCSPLN